MPCNDKNPLVREGTSALSRVLAALSTSYAMVDERRDADLLLFAKRYASFLNYYTDANLAYGDWEIFMKMDISVVLATLDKIDLRAISDYKKLIYKRIKLASIETADPEIKTSKQFKYLFDILFSLVTLVDEQYRLIPDALDFKIVIKDVITSKLSQVLVNLDQLYSDFESAPLQLIDETIPDLDSDAPFTVQSSARFNKTTLSEEWYKIPNPAPPPDLVDLTSDVVSLTIPPAFTVQDKIVYLINHNIFNDQIESLLNGIASIVKHAAQLFEQTIVDFPEHTPHYGLFLTFVKLFRFAQDSLNTYTQRHLDFYYKEALQLLNKRPEPDHAHLIFELQKPVSQILLPKGSLFEGGKDALGKEISYSLTDDLVINKSSVSKIQSWQKTTRSGKDVLIASLVANSEDSLGAKLTSADKSWFTFGDRKKTANAKSGFALASNLLFLNEGTRTITITLTFSGNISDLNSPSYNLNCFSAALTGKKDWFYSNGLAASFPSSNQIQFEIQLKPDDPAIIPYSEKVHKENLNITLPLIKIYLDQDVANSIPYAKLCNHTLSIVKLKVTADNVKDLMLSHNGGAVDASKPFKPFGDFPDIGASFYIGSKEIFQKQLDELTLNLDATSVINTFNPTVNYLTPTGYKDYTLTSNNLVFSSGSNAAFVKTAPDFTANEPLKATTLEGFLRIKLNDGTFSLSKHLINVSASMSLTTITRDTTITTPKYNIHLGQTPVPTELLLDAFSLNYSASETITFSASDDRTNNLYFHFTPFGYYEVHPSLFPEGITALEANAKLTLLSNLVAQAELFIGFDAALPDTVVSVLFQVADGSSNPLKDMEILSWFYLTDNDNWKIFESRLIVDNTNNFTQSGTVVFTLPADISNDNTALQQGLHWIKATVAQNPDAVCKMIVIQAQAGMVQLIQDEANEIEFRKVLPAATISKLVESVSEIKTITQPFDSFDGRTRESDEHFYVRVSERLRHKQRAISIWDYEHIVLEKFQKIYKVKCLNHSGFYPGPDGDIFCENFPGHVTIITLPDLKNMLNRDTLRPYTPVGLLTNIKDYLKTIISPFVKLDVKNPQFEEIRLSFKVQFHEHLNVSFYQQLLNMEIEKFLTPWAWNNGTEISFGGKINKSVLLNFVEEREYVDFVTFFRMDHIIERDGNLVKKSLNDIEEAIASTSRSILVSYYNEDATDESQKRHLIDTQITC